MSGNLDAFCERCGKTAVSPLAGNSTNSGVLRRLLPGARGSKQSANEASALRLCLGCRGYICSGCWNNDAGVCQTCQPLDGAGVAVPTEEDEESIQPGFEIVDDVAADEVAYGRPNGEVSAWPATDLVREPAWPEVDAEPPVAFASEEEWTPRPDWTAEPEAEPDVNVAAEAAEDQTAETFDDRWEELLNRVQAVGVADVEPTRRAPAPAETPEPELTAEPEPELTAEPEPELVAEPEPELVAEPEPELVAEPEPELVAELVAEPEPEPVAEYEAVAGYEPAAVAEERVAELETEPSTGYGAVAELEPVAAEPEIPAEAQPVAEFEAVSAELEQVEVEPEEPAEAEPMAEPQAVEAAAPVDETAAAAAVEPDSIAVEPEAAAAEPEPAAEAVDTNPEEDLWAAVLEHDEDESADTAQAEPDSGEISQALQPRRVRRRVARAYPRRVARPSAFFEADRAMPADVEPAPAVLEAAPEQAAPVEPTPPPAPKVLRLPPALPPTPAPATAPWPMPAPPAFIPPPPPQLMSAVQPAPARFRPQISLAPEPPKPPSTRPCSNCGLELSAKVTFCRRCGTRQPVAS